MSGPVEIVGDWEVRRGTIDMMGQSVPSHAHNFGHLTIFHGKGRIETLEREDGPVLRSVDKEPGDEAWIPAGVFHRLIARQAFMRYSCWFMHRNEQGDVVQSFTGWMPGSE